MKLRNNFLTGFFAGSLICQTSLAGLPDTYSSAPFEGTVVDGKGSPISGAVVVASWLISPIIYFHGPTKFKLIYLAEVVTDVNGKYFVPSSGPIPRPNGWARLESHDPAIAVFKPGFQPTFRNNVAWKTNEQTGPPLNSPDARILRAAYDGKEITLYKYDEKTQQIPSRSGNDSSITRDPRTETIDKLRSLVFFLESNVQYADDDDAASGSQARIRAMRLQRQAVLLADNELKRLRVTHHWRTGIDFLRGD